MREDPVSSEVVYECPIFKVEHAIVELPGGARAERWYAVKNSVAGVVPVDELGHLILTREYRSASGEVRWRIPIGSINPDETPESAARRELREETGLNARLLTPLVTRRRPSGWIKQVSHFFLAEKLFGSPLSSGEIEQIELHRLTQEKVKSKISSAEMGEGTAVALTKALDLLESRQTDTSS